MRSRISSRVLTGVAALAAVLLIATAWLAREGGGTTHRTQPHRSLRASAVKDRDLIDLRGEVRKGQPFRTSLANAGIPSPTIDTILACLGRGGFDFGMCRPGERFTARTDSTGRLHAFLYEVDRLTAWRIVTGRSGTLAAQRQVLAVELDTVAVDGRISVSVYQSILDLGETPELVATFADVLGYDIDFVFDPREGDRFRVLVEKKMLDGECVGYGRMLAASYDGEETGHVAGYWYKDSTAKAEGWFSPEGGNLARAFMRSPLSILRVTSGFGMRRHPISGQRRMHTGTDYGAPTGTPAWSVASGTVAFAGRRGGYGNLIEVRHAGGVRTRYGHLSRILVRTGQSVRQRQTIGLVGSTGYSTGPHLHFEYIVGGRQVAPRSVKNPALQRLPKDRMPHFVRHMHRVDSLWSRIPPIAVK